MVFNFEFTHRRWTRGLRPGDRARRPQSGGRRLAVLCAYNHDLPRHVTRYGGRHPDEVARVAAARCSRRGTPFVYYGEEIGLRDVPLRRGQIVDPPGRRYWPIYKGRDPTAADAVDTGLNAGFHQRNAVAPSTE